MSKDTSSIDDDPIQLDDYPPSVTADIVEAVCIGIKQEFYPPWAKNTFVFRFRIYEPTEFEGVVLSMYVPLGLWWKEGLRPSTASKMAKVANIGGCKRKFLKNAFVGKAFRCRVKCETKGDAPYSVIEMILEKLTG